MLISRSRGRDPGRETPSNLGFQGENIWSQRGFVNGSINGYPLNPAMSEIHVGASRSAEGKWKAVSVRIYERYSKRNLELFPLPKSSLEVLQFFLSLSSLSKSAIIVERKRANLGESSRSAREKF